MNKKDSLVNVIVTHDQLHEARIKRARERLVSGSGDVREAAREMVRLIRARSPEQVARMEAQRGLCG